MTKTTWEPTHISTLDGSTTARLIESGFGYQTFESENGEIFTERDPYNWREIRLVPTLSQNVWRVRRLDVDEYGRVTVTIDAPSNVGGVTTFQTMEFTTLDPPALGDEFVVTVTPKEEATQ